MNFRLASTFTASLARLTHQETKAVKTTAFDLQLDPSAPGLRFHRVDASRDPDFWTVRVNDDLRIVVHKRGPDFLLAWVAGDIGQRIFRQPFSSRALGIDICGRSRILKVNYRTSHQIRSRSASAWRWPPPSSSSGRSMTPSATCSTYPAPGPANACSSSE